MNKNRLIKIGVVLVIIVGFLYLFYRNSVYYSNFTAVITEIYPIKSGNGAKSVIFRRDDIEEGKYYENKVFILPAVTKVIDENGKRATGDALKVGQTIKLTVSTSVIMEENRYMACYKVVIQPPP